MLKNCRWLRYWGACAKAHLMAGCTYPAENCSGEHGSQCVTSIADIPLYDADVQQEEGFPARLKLWRNRSVRLTVW